MKLIFLVLLGGLFPQVFPQQCGDFYHCAPCVTEGEMCMWVLLRGGSSGTCIDTRDYRNFKIRVSYKNEVSCVRYFKFLDVLNVQQSPNGELPQDSASSVAATSSTSSTTTAKEYMNTTTELESADSTTERTLSSTTQMRVSRGSEDSSLRLTNEIENSTSSLATLPTTSTTMKPVTTPEQNEVQEKLNDTESVWTTLINVVLTPLPPISKAETVISSNNHSMITKLGANVRHEALNASTNKKPPQLVQAAVKMDIPVILEQPIRINHLTTTKGPQRTSTSKKTLPMSQMNRTVNSGGNSRDNSPPTIIQQTRRQFNYGNTSLNRKNALPVVIPVSSNAATNSRIQNKANNTIMILPFPLDRKVQSTMKPVTLNKSEASYIAFRGRQIEEYQVWRERRRVENLRRMSEKKSSETSTDRLNGKLTATFNNRTTETLNVGSQLEPSSHSNEQALNKSEATLSGVHMQDVSNISILILQTADTLSGTQGNDTTPEVAVSMTQQNYDPKLKIYITQPELARVNLKRRKNTRTRLHNKRRRKYSCSGWVKTDEMQVLLIACKLSEYLGPKLNFTVRKIDISEWIQSFPIPKKDINCPKINYKTRYC